MAADHPPEYRIRFQSAKKIIKVFQHELPAKNVLLTNSEINTSYEKSYKDF